VFTSLPQTLLGVGLRRDGGCTNRYSRKVFARAASYQDAGNDSDKRGAGGIGAKARTNAQIASHIARAE